MKKITAIVFFVITAFSLSAQNQKIPDKLYEARLDSLVEDLIFGDDELRSLFGLKDNFHFLYMRTGYDSRTFYAGREIGDQMYNMSGQLYYFHSTGLFAGVTGAWYGQLDPAYRITVFNLGYSQGLKKKKFFRYRASFDYLMYHNTEPDFDPTYTSGLNFGTTFKVKPFGARLDASFLLGKEVGTNFSADLFSQITLVKLNKYNKIRFEPELSFYFGSETAEYERNNMLDDVVSEPVDTYYQDVFGLMNIQLDLPILLTFKGLDMEFSWTHHFPHSLDPGLAYPRNSFFNLSIGYIFNL